MPVSSEFYRRHLPHWQPHGAVFFVTFRLKDSLPAEVCASVRDQRHALASDITGGRSFVKWDEFLHSNPSGRKWLASADIASVIDEALRYRDGSQYILHAHCIMPNHVHAVIELLQGEAAREAPLNKVMQSLKRQTARKANSILGRVGAFWQDETYDHVVRDHKEFNRTIAYILNNPVKAGLVARWTDWAWTYCRDGLL